MKCYFCLLFKNEDTEGRLGSETNKQKTLRLRGIEELPHDHPAGKWKLEFQLRQPNSKVQLINHARMTFFQRLT